MRIGVLAILVFSCACAFAQRDITLQNAGLPNSYFDNHTYQDDSWKYDRGTPNLPYTPKIRDGLPYTLKFQGTVTSTDKTLQQLTLSQANNKGTQTFVGKLRGMCYLPTGETSSRVLQVEDLPAGTVLEAHYVRPIDPNEPQVYNIASFTFHKLYGKRVSDRVYRTASCR